jgi:hypothetical protein
VKIPDDIWQFAETVGLPTSAPATATPRSN